MRIKNLHRWDVSTREAREIQEQLAGRVVCKGGRKTPRIVAGADLSFANDLAYAGVILLTFPSLEVIGRFTRKARVRFPYIPGLLSFREAPLLLELFKTVRPAPELIFFDGQGLAHPRRLGLASHLGLFLDCPTIGCAKSRLIGTFREPGVEKGSVSDLLDDENKVIGAVVRSREGCKPIFVSVGHRIGLKTAARRTLQCATRYRIPEPTRLAHLLVKEFRLQDSHG